MSELGVFAVDRGIFDHPVLATSGPYSRREAWLWLLSEAAWKPRKIGRAGAVIELQRGQLAHSVRFMADAWGWSKSSVDRFLTRLKTGTMIGTTAGTGVLVITICNYDAYQRVGLPDRDDGRDMTGTAAGQTRNIQSIKEDIMSEPAGSDAAKPSRKRNVYPDEFEASWRAYPTDANMSKPKSFAAWKKLDAQDRAMLEASIPAFVTYCQKRPDYRPVHMVRYITDRRFEGHAQSGAGQQPADWSKRLTYGRQWRQWPVHQWGPIPGHAGCHAPADLLLPGDGEGWQEARAA